MNLDPAPRQSKLIYLAIDAGLLVTAFVIVYFSKDPYAPLPFVSAVLCVVIAAAIGLVPFLIDYAADSAEYVQAERGRIADQAQRLHAATESLARAAAQIKAVEEAVHKTAHAAENLPYRMQEKLAEFNETLAAKESEETEALERELDELRAANSDNLKAVADRLAKATSEWSAVETAGRKQLAQVQDASAKFHEQLKAAIAQLDAKLAEINAASARLAVPPPPAPVAPVVERAPAAPEPVVETPVAAAPVEAAPVVEAPAEPAPTPVIESVTLTGAPAAAPEAKPRKPRAPRKPKPEETLTAMSSEPAAEPITPPEPAPAAEAPAEAPAEEASAPVVEASASSDGATRLLVTAYIGIGNKLFIRGEGPGLSWDKGIPMQFVSIGKWGWASHDVSAPVKCKLYKNDETAALSGDVTLEPGKHVEVTALF